MPPVRSAMLWFLLTLLGAVGGTGPIHADEAEQVERFLARLGLVDLQARHLEQSVEELPPGADRQKVATRLADLYSVQLVERSENKAAYDEVLQRIQQLVERVPEARTASLEVMLLQADYFRAESLMSKWIADRKETGALAEAAEILARIAPQLDQRQQQLQAAVDRLLAELEGATAGEDQEVRQQEWMRMQAVAGRAAFFAAWANYYLALAQPAGTATPGFQRARDIFRKILGIDGAYTDLDPSGLGLESIWRARTLIGLGLAEAASGNIPGSRACFDLLDRSAAPAEVREQSLYWRVQSLLNAGQVEEAVAFAEPVVAAFTGSPSQGKVSFCVSLVRAAFGGAAPPMPAMKKLGMLGLTGLIKLRQLAAVRQLLEKYSIPVDAEAGFHLAWLAGQQKLDAAEKSKRAEDYQEAERALAAALEHPEAAADLASAAQCRYQLAWCRYKSEQFESAAKTYLASLEGLKATDPKTAPEAAWMAFVSYHALARNDRQFVQPAVQVLRQLQRDFPQHPYAERAEYYAGKLQQAALPPEQTIANLAKVPPGSPDYLAARFDICQLLYEQWAKSAGDRDQWASQVLDAVETYLASATAEPQSGRRLRVALIGAAVALEGDSRNEAAAVRYLDIAKGSSAGAPAPVLAEFHYRSLQLATQRSDDPERRRHARWIVQNAAGSPFELPALIVVAKALEQQTPDPAAASREQLEEGRDIYQRLAEQWGNDPATLKATRNAQVAISRLASYQAALGEHGAAADQLDQLLAAFPADTGYLQRAGRSAFAATDYPRALQHWRKLVGGLPKGSDAWYEAKYYQLASLAQVDRETARQAWQQFRLLFPDLGPPAWRGKFAELQQQVE